MVLYPSFYINTNTATLPNMKIRFNGGGPSQRCPAHRAAAAAAFARLELIRTSASGRKGPSADPLGLLLSATVDAESFLRLE
jgi:hypothetical protein